ncbi:MAG: metallophosphoesterase [Zavarzinella sp.]|nr:metallophosphoesterase [Zavarzinella sp.]
MPKITRRRFFATLGTALAGTGAYAYGIEPHLVTVVRRDLPIAGLPADLDGKRLVQISDLHVGPTGDDYLIDCLGRVGKLRPALIVITGDFMTARGTEELDRVGRVLGHLPKAPLGVFGSLGNHDYGLSWRDTRIADALAPVLADAGVHLLRNERADAAGLQVVGLDELWARQFRPEQGLAEFDFSRPGIVLSHNPDTVDRPGWGKYQGWVLSGHTHGGQCKVPIFGAPCVPVQNSRYVAGEIDLGDGRRLYINRGLGFNRRIRFNARPEITAFTLRRVDRLV